MKVTNNERQEDYDVTQESSLHRIGEHDAIGVNAQWAIVDDTMIVTGLTTTNQSVFTLVYNFLLSELTTSDRVYTKFKYIQ